MSSKYYTITMLLIVVVFAVLASPDASGSREGELSPLSSPALVASDSGVNASVSMSQAPVRREIILEWVIAGAGQDRFYPSLIVVNQGDTVHLTFINNDTVVHDVVIGPPYNIHLNASIPGLANDLTGEKFTTPATNNSPGVVVSGSPGSVTATYSFIAKYAGIFEFVCSYHVQVGMIGYLIVLPNSAFNSSVEPNVTGPQSPTVARVSIDAGSGINLKLPGYTLTDITVVIGVNNTVSWTNNDNMPHTVTAVDGSFDSGNMNAGQSFVRTFSKAGTYPYTCTYHPWMHGTVTVIGTVSSQQSTTVRSLQSTTISSLQSRGYGDFTVTLTGYEIYGALAFGIVILVALMVAFAKTGRRNTETLS